jgi:hypothetical protein
MKRHNRSGREALKRLYDRDNGICHLCGEFVPWGTLATRDHILPWHEGGRIGHGMANLALAHRACNAKRGGLTVEEFRAAHALMLERSKATGAMRWPHDVTKPRLREITAAKMQEAIG